MSIFKILEMSLFISCSSTANKYMLRSLARVAGGAYEFFDLKTKSKWEKKVRQNIMIINV